MPELFPQHTAVGTETETITLGETRLVPDLSGALWLPDARTLLVADLHFEKGSSFAARGVHLPPYDTGSTLSMLEQAAARYQPERIVSLGDSFHDDTSRTRMSDADVGRIRAMTGRTDFVWITGNHDTTPPDDLGGTITGQLTVGELALQHQPSGGLSFSPEVSGHLHPVAAVSAPRPAFAAALLCLGRRPACDARLRSLHRRPQRHVGGVPSGVSKRQVLGVDAGPRCGLQNPLAPSAPLNRLKIRSPVQPPSKDGAGKSKTHALRLRQ